MKDCLEIITNYYCNLNCSFCSQNMTGFNPQTRLILKEIYKAKKEGFKRIGFSGGESTLRKDLPFLIKAASKTGFDFIRLQTNGYKLSEKRYAGKLMESGLTYSKFTFLSHKSLVHDELVGQIGAFEKSFKGLKNFTRKIGVGVNILLNRYNYKELKKTMTFFWDNDVSDFVIIYPIYVSHMYQNRSKLAVSAQMIGDYLTEVMDMASSFGVLSGIKVLNIPPCLLGKYADRSSDYYKFNTVVCEPGIGKYDVDENVKKNKKKRILCNRCVYFEKCAGVDKNYLKIFGWKEFIPVKSKTELQNAKSIKNAFYSKSYFTSSERCVLDLLNKNNFLNTEEIIKKSQKSVLCKGCKDGLNVLNALSSLYDKNVVDKKFLKGKYFWKLK
ncbi:MAG TPA: radical SAM protein [Elusimicrobiales bacterium]|nr:radical SAM protein [Elusimicrobiales bacterium]HPO95636.1 radical SAM protein [Elusimicrobiales bacterium]